jgi:hypothetical protein
MVERVRVFDVQIAPVLHALDGTGISADACWTSLAALVRELAPRDRELLKVWDALQGHGRPPWGGPGLMLVHDRPWRYGWGGRRSWLGLRSRP